MKIHSQISVLIGLFLFSSLALSSSQKGTLTGDLLGDLDTFLQNYATKLAANDYRSDYSVGNIDPRMKLKQCESPWELEFSRHPMKQARSTILAQCNDIKPIKLYISVNFAVFGPSVLSSQLITRGQTITAQQLKVAEVQINTARHDTFKSPDPVIGMIAKRTIKAGRPITPPLLTAPRLVNRGDEVMIIASNSNIAIRMPGEALSHGTLGQQISVRNKQSNRVIRARVTSKGLVRVLL